MREDIKKKRMQAKKNGKVSVDIVGSTDLVIHPVEQDKVPEKPTRPSWAKQAPVVISEQQDVFEILIAEKDYEKINKRRE